MKKVICCILLGIFLCVGLVGCNSVSTVTASEINMSPYMYEFVDQDTGVHYWIYSRTCGYGGMGGMTPRLNSDGTVMITK